MNDEELKIQRVIFALSICALLLSIIFLISALMLYSDYANLSKTCTERVLESVPNWAVQPFQ